MATAEASPSTIGPRYAPDDPTLPEPWKGLIDGSTGVLYYWNPETNVTQYEKPTSLPPPLPPGPPPSTPKMNPIPAARASQSDNVQTPQNQQTLQTQLPHGQLHGSHLGPSIQQGQQVPSHLGQMPIQQGQQGLPQSMQQMQPGHQAPYQHMPHHQHGQMYSGAPMGTPHGFQYTQYATHQQNMSLQGPPSSSEQPQHLNQGQQLPHKQESKMELGQRDDNEFHQAKQPGFSPAHQHLMQGQQFPQLREQKPGIPPRDDEFQQVNQAGFSPAQVKMSMQPNQNAQYGGPSANMPHNNPSVHLQQAGSELTYQQHGPRFQNQMGPGMMHGQQQNLPPVGSKMPYEENHLGMPGNEYFYNTKDANAVPHQQPKLAPLPTNRNQQVN